MQGWKRQGARGDARSRRSSSGLVQVGWLCAVGLASSACAPGKLTAAEEKAFKQELKEHYGAASATSSSPLTPDTAPPPSASTPLDASLPAIPSTPASSFDASIPAEPDSGPPVIPECVSLVFATSCAGSACHYGNGLRLTPNLEREDLGLLLSQEGPSCASAQGAYFLDLAEPLNSYLRTKLRNEQPAGCGDVMPPVGQPALTELQLQCLEDWFASIPKDPRKASDASNP